MKMQKQKLDIYNFGKKDFEKNQIKLQESKISKRNKEIIESFQNYLFASGTGDKRVIKMTRQLRFISEWLKSECRVYRDLDKLQKEDIISLIAYINRNLDRSEATKADFRKCIKQFFNWFIEEDPRLYSRDEYEKQKTKQFYKYIKKEIKRTYKQQKIDPSTIITEQDLNLVVEKGAKTHREKAFLTLLHETGCRIEEALNIRFSNITIKENHGEIFIPFGKTGERTVLIRKSIPHLMKYLEVHPQKEELDYFLWLSESPIRYGKPLLYGGARKILNRCFENAGCKKRHNPHWFRHSRASILAPKMTEVMLCKYMGWIVGSKQPSNYLHLCCKQMEDIFLDIHGVRSQEIEKEQPIKCICGNLNDPKERYCSRCYKPLKIETVIQDQELVDSEMNKTVKLIMEIAKNPQLMEAFQKFKERK